MYIHVSLTIISHLLCTGSITAVTADGILFAHPLHHLGKSKQDLPLVAIDSFRHMYVVPNFEDIK